ncbi:MAG: cysteine desulfurase [Clostridia bacterium]|nr:cysteine desulfurase [Clostridia bacterium]
MNNIYFDNAATTPIKTEVLNEMMPYLTRNYGNASSLYSIGRQSKRAIENARKQVAELINCNPHEIYFTGGGSESDNMALKGFAYANREKGNHIITSKIEHHAVLESCERLEKQGFEVSYINVNNEGIIDLQELENSIRPSTILISVMSANNEIGTIQPVEEISEIAQKYNIAFHTDAVQAIGNTPIDVQKMRIDMLSMSGHKINGPKGIGALYIKKGIEIEKIIDGGHQEKNIRAGTENVAGIVGIGKACEISNKNIGNHIKYLKKLRDYYIKRLQIELPNKIRINGDIQNRLPGNANISFKDLDSSEVIFKLDEKGICVSSGSACSSGSTEHSYVLTAIKTPQEYLNCAIRTTFGENNTFEEIDYLIKTMKSFY